MAGKDDISLDLEKYGKKNVWLEQLEEFATMLVLAMSVVGSIYFILVKIHLAITIISFINLAIIAVALGNSFLKLFGGEKL